MQNCSKISAAEEYGDIIQRLPLLGEVTFTSKDIDKLYRLIQYGN